MNRLISQRTIAAIGALLIASVHAASTCPFDTGGSDALNDGLVLTRYALGITGAPLVASTRYASLDPLQVKANIQCVGCALDINGDGVVDAVDTTIIARHLAGFQGASLTAGLALGSGTRPDAASVTSFLANGCAVGGAINAFVQNGNSFGAPAVLGTNDNQPVTVKTNQSTIKLLVDPANGDDGLRISYATRGNGPGSDISPNTVNGSRANSVAAGTVGATIAGGGTHITVGGDVPNQNNGNYGTIGGGYGNTIASSGYDGTISGGIYNSVSGVDAVVGGGTSNTAGAGLGSQSQTVAGGNQNVASGNFSTVPGGLNNTAAGSYSFAAGRRAKADHQGSFVWGDSTNADVLSTGNDQFVIRATGGIRLPGAGKNEPGNATNQSGTNMFTHVVPSSGPCFGTAIGGLNSRTAIDHPLTNDNPNAILVVTPNGSNGSVGQNVYVDPVAVYYATNAAGGSCTAGRWMIYSISKTTAMTAGQLFNVFVINP